MAGRCGRGWGRGSEKKARSAGGCERASQRGRESRARRQPNADFALYIEHQRVIVKLSSFSYNVSKYNSLCTAIAAYTRYGEEGRMKHDALREQALANFESLLSFWKIEYRKITNVEYDIIATWRSDRDFGSVRFNIEKGRGADFAGCPLAKEDFARLGIGFNKDDFVGFSDEGQSKIGFDIIGLCQRIYNCNTYQQATEYLKDDIEELSKRNNFVRPAEDAAERRNIELQRKRELVLKYASAIWEACRHHKLENTPGERYLSSRKINIKEYNMRFHPRINYTPTKQAFPALIFRVQENPFGALRAIHRVYLSHDGKKADIDNPKMALASIKDCGIWFGEKNEVLFIAEGPENALSLRAMGAKFVVSTVYATNFPNIKIPPCVKKIVLAPDVDNAGMNYYEKALIAYKRYVGVQIEDFKLMKIPLPNGKFADINDALIAMGAI